MIFKPSLKLKIHFFQCEKCILISTLFNVETDISIYFIVKKMFYSTRSSYVNVEYKLQESRSESASWIVMALLTKAFQWK